MGWMSSQGIRVRSGAVGSQSLLSQHSISAGRKSNKLRWHMSRWLSAIAILSCFSNATAVGIDYHYNDKGQLDSATYDNGTVVTYQYDENGNRKSATSTGGPDIKPPTVPTNVVATVVSSIRLDVAWTASTDDRSTGVTGYKIERCTGVGCTNFAQVYTIAKSPFQNSNLVANTTYRFRVRAYDAAGNTSDPSDAVPATTKPDTQAPPAPSITVGTVTSSQISLTWSGVNDPGGSGLGGYRIERCSGVSCTNFAQIKQQTAPGITDTGLASTNSYTYRVFAYDKAGNISAESNRVSATTLADTVAPTQPTGLKTTSVSPLKVSLSWTASTDSGGAGLAGYKIERCLSSSCSFTQIGTSSTNSYADSTAQPNTSYKYQVRAYDNASPANNSTYSTSISVTTPADTTVPSVPTGLSAAVQSSTSIKLTWTASTDSGGNLSGYNIERCLNAGCTSFVNVGTASVSGQATETFLDIGLSALKTYLYRINAKDAVGNVSAYSTTVTATTTADTQAPTNPSASVSVVSSTQLTVNFTGATDSGGTALAGFEIGRCQGSGCTSCQGTGCTNFAVIGTVNATATNYPDSSLRSSTTYAYRIRAYDAASPANYSSGVFAQGATSRDTISPSAPTGLATTAVAANRVDLKWTAPSDQGGAGVTSYRVDRCTSSCSSYTTVATLNNAGAPGTIVTGSDTSAVDGVTYSYVVYAIDRDGNVSAASIAVQATTPDITKPNPPTSYAFANITPSSATVTWSGATDNVGVTGYQYQLNGGSWTATSANTASFGGLTCYTTYTVSVQARDAAGYWSNSSSGSFTTTDGCAPGAPGTPSFSVSYTSATASWAAASDNVGVTAYQYSVNGGAWSSPIASTSVSLTGLTIGTTYTLSARAGDAAGNWGPASAAGSFTTPSPSITIPASLTGSSSGSGNATAYFYINANGTIETPTGTSGSTQSAGNWLSPVVAANQFTMVLSNMSSTCSSSASVNTTVPVSARVSVRSSTPGQQNCYFDITIRNPYTGDSRNSHVTITSYAY